MRLAALYGVSAGRRAVVMTDEDGGLVAAMGSVALAAWLAMTFYGGFEINIAIFLGALSLAPGGCLAGAYAGFLRSRENQAVQDGRLVRD